jgi:guanyl-specific ribonuclease Sa
MRHRAYTLCILLLLALISCTRHEPGHVPGGEDSAIRVPDKAITVYEHVLRTGAAPDGYVGGRTFENRERRLPEGNNYREYDVNPRIRGENRGPERLIIDHATGNAWYTPDHYRTFYVVPRKGSH